MGARPGAAAYKSIMLMVTLATIAGTIWLYIVVPKGFFPTEDTGYVIGITEGNTDIVVPGHGQAQRKVAEIVRARPGGGLRQFDGRRRRPELVAEQRPHAGRAQAAATSAASCSAVIARLRKNANVVTGMADIFPADPEHQSRRQAVEEPVPIHAAIERYRRALSAGAGIARQDRQDSPGCSTSPPTSTSRIRRSRSRSTARKPRSTA